MKWEVLDVDLAEFDAGLYVSLLYRGCSFLDRHKRAFQRRYLAFDLTSWKSLDGKESPTSIRGL